MHRNRATVAPKPVLHHGLVERVRRGTQRFVDQLAWGCLTGEFHPRSTVWALSRRIDELAAQARDVDAMRASLSWRVTAPLRALRRLAGF